MAKKILLGILITIVLLFTGLWPIAILFGFPLAIIYAIYKAVTGIMTHNAELKSRYGNNGNQDTENRWTSGQ